MSASIARPRGATGLMCPISRPWSPGPLAVKTSRKRSRAWPASRSTCAIRVSGETRPNAWPNCPSPPPWGSRSRWVYVDVRGRDLASVANERRDAVSRQIKLEPGVSITYSGQFEYLERANARLKVVVPATLLIIFVLLYLTFSRMGEAGLIMATLPFALTGGIWFLYLMNYNLSIATGVGFIALAGVAAEFGVVMLIYLKQALAE